MSHAVNRVAGPGPGRLRWLACLALGLALLGHNPARAAEGDLDASFGSNGVATANVAMVRGGVDFNHAALDASGRRLLIGGSHDDQTSAVLMRTLANGELDTTFNGTGILVGAHFPGVRVHVLSTGKIVTVGRTSAGDYWVVRLNDDGTVDQTYGTGGSYVWNRPGKKMLKTYSVLQPDDKLIISGWDVSLTESYLLRVTAAGVLDTSFGAAGAKTGQIVTTSRVNGLLSVMFDASKRMVAFRQASNGDPEICRYQAYDGPNAGEFDTTFSGDGKISYRWPGDNRRVGDVGEIFELTSGNYLVAGFSDARTDTPRDLSWQVTRITASDGTIDTTFGNGSSLDARFAANDGFIALHPWGGADYGGAQLVTAALQADGKIVLMGQMSNSGSRPGIVRLTANGDWDTTFGTNGVKYLPASLNSVQQAHLARLFPLAGGALLLCSYSNSIDPGDPQSSVSWLTQTQTTSSGADESGFGPDGDGQMRQAILTPTVDTVVASVRDASGRLLVVGNAQSFSWAYAYRNRGAIARFKPDGTKDATFGTGGSRFIIDFRSIADVAVQSDGKIVVAGTTPILGTVVAHGLVARLHPDGTLDTTFGSGGFWAMPVPASYGESAFHGVAIDSQGRIIAVGTQAGTPLAKANDDDFLVVRLTSGGVPDTAFNGTGVFKYDSDTTSAYDGDVLHGVVVTTGDALLVGGEGEGSDDYTGPKILRITASGALDTGFGTGGVVSLNNSYDGGLITRMVEQGGHLYAVGQRNKMTLLARLNPTTGAMAAGFPVTRDANATADDYDLPRGLAIDSTGRWLVSGQGTSGSVRQSFIVRTTAAGALDSTFAVAGRRLPTQSALATLAGVHLSSEGVYAYVPGSGQDELSMTRVVLGTAPSQAPVITEGATVAVTCDEDQVPTPFALTLHASDADSSSASLTWTIGSPAARGVAGLTLPAQGGSAAITYLPAVDYHGSDAFTVVVSDGLLTDTVTVQVTVAPQVDVPSGIPDLALRVNTNAATAGSTVVGPTLQIGGSSSLNAVELTNGGTANLGVASMTLVSATNCSAVFTSSTPTGIAAGGTGQAVVSLSPGTTVGTYAVQLVVRSTDPDTDPYTVTISGGVVAAGAAPVLTSSLSATGTVGVSFGYVISATNSPTSFNATGLPAGLTVNTTTGIISGIPAVAGTSNVVISAVNSTGPASQTVVLTINSSASTVPVISSALSRTETVGVPLTYSITATQNPTSFAASGLPAGLALDAATGVISGTPTTVGDSSIFLSAANASGTGTATLTLTIQATSPPAPVITSATTATGTVGTALTYSITASNAPTSYSATGVPAGLTLNTTTGVISGTPTTEGTSMVTLYATNAGGTGSATLSLTIQAASTPVPVITSATTATGTVGTALTYTITASNAPTSYSATGVPAGLTLNTTTGVISGTPTTEGTSMVTLNATNAGGTGSATLSLTIAPATVPTNPGGTGGGKGKGGGGCGLGGGLALLAFMLFRGVRQRPR